MKQPEIGILNPSDPPYAYGDVKTYELGAEFLKDCRTIEDWGCGRGFFKQYVEKMEPVFIPGSGFHKVQYTGIDMGVDSVQQPNPFADLQVPTLVHYLSNPQPEGIFIRHVLEHNFEWNMILANALKSATKKIYIAIYTPLHEEDEEDKVLLLNGPPTYDPPVPNLSLSRLALMKLFKVAEQFVEKMIIEVTEVPVQHSYGKDTVIYVTKKTV